MLRAALYARSSKDRGDVSVSSQLRELRAAIKKDGLALVAEFAEPEAITAKTDDRPAFQEMVAAAKRKPRPFDRLYVYDTSRFSRRREHAVAYKAMLRRLGIEIRFLKVPSTDSYIDGIIEGIMEVFDEFHSTKSRHDALRGMRENVLKGYRAGGSAPTGYRLARHVLGRNIDKEEITKTTLEVDPEMGPVVKEYFARRAKGEPRKRVCEALGGRIKETTGLNMERCVETYLGHTVWNRHDGKEAGNGYRVGAKFRDAALWTVKEGTHPALIDEETAEAVRALLKTNANRGQRPRASNYILTGLLKCGECGSNMTGSAGHYGCGKRCGASYIAQKYIESAVWGWFRDEYLDPSAIKAAAGRGRKRMARGAASAPARAAKLARQASDIDRKIERLFTLFEGGKVDAEVLAARIDSHRTEKARLEALAADMGREEREGYAGKLPDRDALHEAPEADEETVFEYRRLLASAIENIRLVDGGRRFRTRVEIAYRYGNGPVRYKALKVDSIWQRGQREDLRKNFTPPKGWEEAKYGRPQDGESTT